MKNKAILPIQLFRNIMTEKEVNYIAHPIGKQIVTNHDIAHTIGEQSRKYPVEMILEILEMADKEKIQAIIEGCHLADGIGEYQITIKGVFETQQSSFDPRKHTLSISYTPSNQLSSAIRLLVPKVCVPK